MLKKDFIKKVKKMDYPQHLDKSFDGSCPCFWASPIVDKYRIELYGHCWRTCLKCSYNGLHFKSKMPIKDLNIIIKVLKKQLDNQKWYSKYKLVNLLIEKK